MEPLPIWQQDWVWNGVRQTLTGLAVLLLVLLILRPAVKRLATPPARLAHTGDADAQGDDDQAALSDRSKPANALGSPPVVYGDILNMARAMAAEDPKRVAIVVKDWVRES